MLSYLADWEAFFGPLRLFRYLTFRGAGAAAFTLALCFMTAPRVLAKLRALKARQCERGVSEVGGLARLHAHKNGTPTMGGLMIFPAMLAGVLLWARPNIYVLTALFVYISLTAAGFFDDFLKVTRRNSKGLPRTGKWAAQAVIACAAASFLLLDSGSHLLMSELWAPFLKEPLWAPMPLWFIPVFFFFVMAGSSNAINLTDGIDGLAIGCVITVALVFGLVAYAAGHAAIADYLLIRHVPGAGELSVLCACVAAASLAFLWFNSHPAEVFMGDTGSLALGGLIGTVAFMVLQPLLLVLAGGIFVIEALSVILQVASFKLRGKRIFRMSPIHHHFQLLGWPENKVVVRFWILSLVFALSGLATLKIR